MLLGFINDMQRYTYLLIVVVVLHFLLLFVAFFVKN